MKTVQDPEVEGLLEEAGDDLYDAETLARRPGGAAMAQYHAAQAAEKYLAALAFAAERKASPGWDLPRMFEALKDVEGVEAAEPAVQVLAAYTTPQKGEGSWAKVQEAMRAVRAVRRAVLVPLGVEVPEEAPFVPVAVQAGPAPVVEAEPVEAAPDPREQVPTRPVGGDAVADDAPMPTEYEDQPPAGWREPGFGEKEDFPADMRQYQQAPAPERDRRDGGRFDRPGDRRGPPGRSPQDRGTSYVKQFLICTNCGVRLPRTRQTVGRVPCPHCSRPMTLQS